MPGVKGMKSPADMAANWMAAMKSGTTAQKYAAGIDRYVGAGGNPMAAAATPDALALYKARTAESVDSGRRARKLNASSVEDYRTNAKTVGAPRLSTGADKAKKKITAHFADWAQTYQDMSSAAANIPKDGTLATALRKMEAAIRIAMVKAGRQP